MSLGRFSDRRLERGVLLLERRLEPGGRGRVRKRGGGRAGEIRLPRVLRDAAVTPGETMSEAAWRTHGRCQGRDVLALQGTMVVRSSGGRPARRGGAGRGGRRPAGRCGPGALSRAVRRNVLAAAEQSFCWPQGADEAACVCAGALGITVVSDCEGDIFEAFALL